MSSRRRQGSSALSSLTADQSAPVSEKPNHFSKMLQNIEQSNPEMRKQMVPLDDGSIQINQFKITPLGLFGGEGASIQDWENIGKMLFQFHDSLQIILGDWLVNIERVHGKTYEQIAAELGRKPKTLRNWKYVMSSVDVSLRRDNLTYKHYMNVAGMDYQKQSYWLGLASQNNWGAGKMQDEISNANPPPLKDAPILKYSPQVMNKKDVFFARVERISRAFDGKDNPDRQAMREYIRDMEEFIQALRENFGWDEGE